MDGIALLEHDVRELIRRRGVDPLRDPAGLDALVRDALADYDERSLRGHVPPLADPAAATKAVVDAVAGLGPLQPYLDDPEVEEIWINSTDRGVTAGHRLDGCPQSARSPQHGGTARLESAPCCTDSTLSAPSNGVTYRSSSLG